MTKRLTIALIALLAFAMIAMLPAAAVNNINLGSTVFRGEAGLNIAPAMQPGENMLYWWSPGTSVAQGDAFAASVPVSNQGNFFVDPSMQTGAWYNRTSSLAVGNVSLVVADPHLAIAVFDGGNVDRTDGSVIRIENIAQSHLKFRIVSNLDIMSAQRAASANVTIRVGAPGGNVFTSLVNATGQLIDLSANPGTPTNITENPAWITTNWTRPGPDVWDVSKPHYPRGTYTFWVTVNTNDMNDNYGVVGKTRSATQSIELIDEATILTADKDTVIRNNDFALTVTGRPNTDYALWVRGTSAVANVSVPRIKAGQQGVEVNATAANDYAWRTGTTVFADIPTRALIQEHDGTFTAPVARVRLNDAGQRTVSFLTNQSTDDRTFTFRVARIGAAAGEDFDEVRVRIEQGSITITASGDRTYYLGQEVLLSGTNSDSDRTFLFITGPNLHRDGTSLTAPSASLVGTAGTPWVERPVRGDDTWDFRWRTGDQGMIDPGTYTIYAVTTQNDRRNLADATYATESVVIRKGFITATPSATTVARGDSLFVRGVAEGDPDEVQLWIFGVNYFLVTTETVEDDGSYEFELTGAQTTDRSPGQYFMVAQHPMANNQFDVLPDTVNDPPVWVGTRRAGFPGVVPAQSGADAFRVTGAQRLQGSDAAEALTRMLDFQQIDDTYTKLTFLIEEPWISVDTVGDKYVGTQFTITGTTNLGVDNEIIVEVSSTAFRPTDKTASGEFAGQTAVVRVVKGDAGYNTWSMAVDASGFLPDEYIVRVESIQADVTTTTTFNVLEGVPVTPAPATPVPGTPVPATPVPTQPPATPASPGFGALVAIAGLGAVAFLVLRRD